MRKLLRENTNKHKKIEVELPENYQKSLKLRHLTSRLTGYRYLFQTGKNTAGKTGRTERTINLTPVVHKLDSAIQHINTHPMASAIGFPKTYPLDSDLSGG